MSVPEIGAEFAGSGAPREGGGAGASMGVLRAHQEYVVGVRPAGQRSQLYHLLVLYTLITKENLIFLICKEIQNGAVAKSYVTNGLLIYGEMFAHFLIYSEALPHI